jgi:hypothetical protein
MHPGIMVADIGHLKKVFVQAGIIHSFLEQRLMGTGGTGRHDNPV